MPNLSVLVPVYNEAATLRTVMGTLMSVLPDAQIIYIDDGSSDASLSIMHTHARPQDIVLTKENGGKGSAIRLGIEKATGEYCVIQDADLEYDPREIHQLIHEAKAHPGCVVFGSRFLRKNPNIYPLYLLGNKIITTVLNVLFWSTLTDAYTCYKLFPTPLLQRLPLYAKGFELEAELCAWPLKRGFMIYEVPISYNPRTFAEGKKIRARDALQAVIRMLKIRCCYDTHPR